MFNKEGVYYRINPTINYRLEKLTFEKFRNLDGLEIDFSGHAVTGIFGANGLGKSTILNAIRCLYRGAYNPRIRRGKPRPPHVSPPSYAANKPFGHLFFANQFFNYTGSRIIAEFSDSNDSNSRISGLYSLRPHQQRWTPGTTAKPVNAVFYINVSSCVPTLEAGYTKAERDKRARQYAHILKKSQEIVNSFNYIFERNIQLSELGEKVKGVDEKMGVQMRGQLMLFRDLSAGEQRVLRILDILHHAPERSIILIDEIELALHTLALSKLILLLKKVAKERYLQVIFTSHEQSLIDRKDINIRSLYQQGSYIRCDQGFNPNCLALLGGESVTKQYTILVEDEMSKAIVREVLRQKGKLRGINIIPFGGYDVGIELLAYLHVAGKLTDKTILILDGDVLRTQEEKISQLRNCKVIKSKNLPIEEFQNVVAHIRQYNLPVDQNPEQYLYDLLLKSTDEEDEVVMAAKSVLPRDEQSVPQGIDDAKAYLRHYMIDETIRNMGLYDDKPIGYIKVVEFIAKTFPKDWKNFVKSISCWIDVQM